VLDEFCVACKKAYKGKKDCNTCSKQVEIIDTEKKNKDTKVFGKR
jgi:rRNA maturation endonuclease Nob1